MTSNLSLVRKAVIAVVPEIMGNWSGCNVCGMMCDVCDVIDKEKRPRSILLADVLRSIKSNKRISAKKWFEAVDFLVARAQWNLTLSLDDQPQPVIDFLASLFK